MSSSLAGLWSTKAIQLVQDLMEQQGEKISTAAQWCADSILNDGVVHLFGTGHSTRRKTHARKSWQGMARVNRGTVG